MPRVYKPKTNRKYGHEKPTTLPTKFRAGFLAELDKRTELAKALRDYYASIVSDIGGPESIGHVKAALIERFCWLEAILQTLEHEMANGTINKSDALGKWIQAVNSLSGLAKVLGIERNPRQATWAKLDAMPTPTDDNEETREHITAETQAKA